MQKRYEQVNHKGEISKINNTYGNLSTVLKIRNMSVKKHKVGECVSLSNLLKTRKFWCDGI